MKELYRVVQPNSDEVIIGTDNLYDNSSFKEEVINAIDYRYSDIDMELLEIMADYYIKHDLCESQLGMLIEKMEVKRDEQKEVAKEITMTPTVIERALEKLKSICRKQECCDNCPCKDFCPHYNASIEESPSEWDVF